MSPEIRVNAVWMVATAELRHRWRSWLVLAVLVAGIGGLVLATAAAGRRTASAFPRYLKTYGFDEFVYSLQPLEGIAQLPEVRSVVTMPGPASGPPECPCGGQIQQSNFGTLEVPPAAFPHFAKLVQGRLANPRAVDEAVASYSLAHDVGLHLGSVLRIPLFGPDQAKAAGGETQDPPDGPTVTLRIVGFVASEQDFPALGRPNYTVLLTPAFAEAINPRSFLYYGYTVRLRRGAADIPLFNQDVRALGATGSGDLETASSVTAAIHPQAVGWWVLAIFIGLAGSAAVAQALRRQAIGEAGDNQTLASLGLGPSELRAVAFARTLTIAIAGAAGAVLLAIALSPLAPLGEARIAEPTTGFAADPLLLGLGAAAIIVLVGLLSLPAAGLRVGMRPPSGEPRRASRIVQRLSSWGVPTSAVIGIRRALERGQGDQTVPVGNALAGTAVAVAALCGTAVFGASLGHLFATPRLYGQAFQVWFNNSGPGQDSINPVLAILHQDAAVRRITIGVAGSVEVNGRATDAIAGQPDEGALLISTVQGRLPSQPGEVALGVKTLRQAHASVGSDVQVTVPLPGGGAQASTVRVVGIAAFPPDFGVVGLDRGAIFSLDGLIAAQCGNGPAAQTCSAQARQQLAYVVLAGFTPDAAGRADAARYAQQYPGIANLPQTPVNLVNFGQAVNFPLILGLVVALFSATTVIHVLVVSVARRRRELGLLKALGFLRHQVVAAVCWQACTVAAVGILVGVPLGVAAGRSIWRAFATNLGVVAVPEVPALTIAALCLAVLAGANLLAAGPAAVSARARPASILRSE